MKPAPFVHHAPRSVEEAVAVLGEVGHDGKVLAGGQSLVPLLSMRLASPGHLVDVNTVAGLDAVDVTDEHVRVGALVRHAELERHDGAADALPLLRRAVRHVAHPAIRNRGTTVGSIAHADPAGEMPAVAVLTGGGRRGRGAAGRARGRRRRLLHRPARDDAGPGRARRRGPLRPLPRRHPHDVRRVRPAVRRLRARRGRAGPHPRRRRRGLGARVLRVRDAGSGRPRPHRRSSRGRPSADCPSTTSSSGSAPTSTPRPTSTRTRTTGGCSPRSSPAGRWSR